MAVARFMRSPRQESSCRNRSGVRRICVGWLRRTVLGGMLAHCSSGCYGGKALPQNSCLLPATTGAATSAITAPQKLILFLAICFAQIAARKALAGMKPRDGLIFKTAIIRLLSMRNAIVALFGGACHFRIIVAIHCGPNGNLRFYPASTMKKLLNGARKTMWRFRIGFKSNASQSNPAFALKY